MNFPFNVRGGTLVSVGNRREPFSRLLNEVDRLARLGLLPAPVLVQHGYSPFFSPACQGVHQLEVKVFEDAVRDAKVVIVHAGAGSVLTSLRMGKRPVVMARKPAYQEILDGHQVEFLEHMAGRRLVLPVEDANELLRKVTDVVCTTEAAYFTGPVRNHRLQAAIASILRAEAAG